MVWKTQNRPLEISYILATEWRGCTPHKFISNYYCNHCFACCSYLIVTLFHMIGSSRVGWLLKFTSSVPMFAPTSKLLPASHRLCPSRSESRYFILCILIKPQVVKLACDIFFPEAGIRKETEIGLKASRSIIHFS